MASTCPISTVMVDSMISCLLQRDYLWYRIYRYLSSDGISSLLGLVAQRSDQCVVLTRAQIALCFATFTTFPACGRALEPGTISNSTSSSSPRVLLPSAVITL